MATQSLGSTGEVSVSVMIVNWNRQDYLRETLEDLRKHNYPGMEVIVVDNASTDGSPEMITADFPEVRLISLSENLGQCKGLNVGLQEARANIVISLDNDAILGEGSIERIVRQFSLRPKMAVLHGKIIDYDTREHVWWWDWYGFKEQDYAEREFPTPWKIAEGLCALRRDAALAVGGFPEEYFIMDAGRDLAIKLIDAGYQIIYTPGVVFEHKSCEARERTDRYRLHSDRRMYFKLRNELWTLWKHYPMRHVIAKTPIKMGMWAYVMARRGSFPHYVRAMVDAYKALPQITSKRRPVSRRTLKLVEYSRLRAIKQLSEVMSWYYVVKKSRRRATQER